MSQSRFSIVLVGVSALLRRPLVSRLRPADGERSSWVVFTARVGRFDSGFRSVVGLRVHYFRFSACTDSEWPLGGFVLSPSASEIPFGELAFGFTASVFRHAPLRSGRWAGSFFRLPLRRFRSAGWPSGSPLPLFGTHRFGVALGGLAFGLTASAFRHAPLRRLQLGELAFGLTTSAFRHAPLRSYPRRVGLRAHGFRFSARTDPHRRTAEARADGAHRHDTCFTSKHLSQHVNLPHRSPQALQNRQTPLLSPTRHPRGRRPHAHHRTHREEVHPGFGRREGRGRRTRGRDHRQSPTGTQRATRRPGLFPSHPPLLGGRGLVRTGGRGADQAGARGVPPLVAHSPRPLREGSRRELRAARQKESRRQRATGRFAHGWRYAGSTRAFDGLLGRGLGCDASGYSRACASLDGNARGYTCACRAFAHDVDYHGYARTFDGLLGRGLGCDASGYACTCTSLDGNARGYTCACRAFDGHSRGNARACRAFDGHACRNACACHAFDGYACCERNAGRRGSLTLAHGATPCLRPLRRTAFRLAPHPAERDSAGATCIIIACTAPVSASV